MSFIRGKTVVVTTQVKQFLYLYFNVGLLYIYFIKLIFIQVVFSFLLYFCSLFVYISVYKVDFCLSCVFVSTIFFAACLSTVPFIKLIFVQVVFSFPQYGVVLVPSIQQTIFQKNSRAFNLPNAGKICPVSKQKKTQVFGTSNILKMI
eukprot:TRINITY_DN2568_c0_g1_i1.p2 TRINITY_DN2568_c0_g1~~TRINITY_DN2568_c0_g1_i1.p2  ORF type:complete len:148 (-),score=3.51 TRINITY_DN2568_c0_g1_i1:437-880(-)